MGIIQDFTSFKQSHKRTSTVIQMLKILVVLVDQCRGHRVVERGDQSLVPTTSNIEEPEVDVILADNAESRYDWLMHVQ